MNELVLLVEFSTKLNLFHAAGIAQCVSEGLNFGVLVCPGVNFSSEYDGCGRCAPDNRRVRSLQSRHLEPFVQRPGKHNISTSVISRDHAEHHWSLEIHHGPANFGTVLELQAPHGLG